MANRMPKLCIMNTIPQPTPKLHQHIPTYNESQLVRDGTSRFTMGGGVLIIEVPRASKLGAGWRCPTHLHKIVACIFFTLFCRIRCRKRPVSIYSHSKTFEKNDQSTPLNHPPFSKSLRRRCVHSSILRNTYFL